MYCIHVLTVHISTFYHDYLNIWQEIEILFCLDYNHCCCYLPPWTNHDNFHIHHTTIGVFIGFVCLSTPLLFPNEKMSVHWVVTVRQTHTQMRGVKMSRMVHRTLEMLTFQYRPSNPFFRWLPMGADVLRWQSQHITPCMTNVSMRCQPCSWPSTLAFWY